MKLYYAIPHWHSRKCFEKEEFHWKNAGPALRIIGIFLLGILLGALLFFATINAMR